MPRRKLRPTLQHRVGERFGEETLLGGPCLAPAQEQHECHGGKRRPLERFVDRVEIGGREHQVGESARGVADEERRQSRKWVVGVVCLEQR